jgi:hypothetical protein
MTEFTAAHFEEICNADPVKSQIESIETVRSAAVKQFWMFAVGGGIATLVLAALIGMFTNATVGFVVFILGVIGTLIFAFRPLEAAKKGLKLPMLTALASRGGMEYAAANFQPPFYAGARKALFGSWLSEQTFTDLFSGKDETGKAFAVYEAHLEQGSGKNRTTVFQGQMYGFETTKTGTDTVVVTPDKGLFNFFKPGPGMERVKFESNPEFEKRFEVYSTNPSLANGLLGSTTLQNRLLELRGKGKVFAFVGPGEALFAITGADRFEPGSMFKATAGQERARLMFDDVCGSLAILKELRATFG